MNLKKTSQAQILVLATLTTSAFHATTQASFEAPGFPQPDAPVAPGFPLPIWEKAPISMELQHSLMCLDISEGVSQSIFTQQSCKELFAVQDFKLIPAGQGTYMIQNVMTKLCLDIEGGSTEPGAKLISYPCSGTENQRFLVNPTSQTTATIRALHSGLCLDLLGGQTGKNEELGQWTCTGEKNQEVRFIY